MNADFPPNGGRHSALDAAVRALRGPAHQSDSRRLLEAGAAAVAEWSDELRNGAVLALPRLFALDELALPHLRKLNGELVQPERTPSVRGHESWVAGERFLAALATTYRAALDVLGDPNGQLTVFVETAARRARTGAHLLKWRALAYFPPDERLWRDLVETYQLAVDRGFESKPVALRQGMRAQTSVSREFIRAYALGCASLDQLSPDGIDIADRLVRYMLPILAVEHQRSPEARFAMAPGALAPQRIQTAGDVPSTGLFLVPGDVGKTLDELASVIAKGLVPAVLASGPKARERVLAVLYHLRRLWAGAPRLRRHRRHPLAGKLKALLGFERITLVFSADDTELAHEEGWDMLDASRNGVGILVPAKDCDRIAVGDLLGVQAEDGESWHIGVVRRIVRSSDGSGIVGMESIARSAVAASVDDGRSPSRALLFDPLRRGAAVRLAISPSALIAGGDAVFLSHGGRVCKLRRVSELLRGEGFEVSSYRVL